MKKEFNELNKKIATFIIIAGCVAAGQNAISGQHNLRYAGPINPNENGNVKVQKPEIIAKYAGPVIPQLPNGQVNRPNITRYAGPMIPEFNQNNSTEKNSEEKNNTSKTSPKK